MINLNDKLIEIAIKELSEEINKNYIFETFDNIKGKEFEINNILFKAIDIDKNHNLIFDVKDLNFGDSDDLERL